MRSTAAERLRIKDKRARTCSTTYSLGRPSNLNQLFESLHRRLDLCVISSMGSSTGLCDIVSMIVSHVSGPLQALRLVNSRMTPAIMTFNSSSMSLTESLLSVP